MSSLKDRIALKILSRYKKEEFLDLIEEVLASKQLTKNGLVYINPFQIAVDRENNVYVKTGEVYDVDGFVSIVDQFQSRHPLKEGQLSKIWPTFRR